jgi:hypothetical protein
MKDEECIEEVIITVFPPMMGIGIVEQEPVLDEEEACGDSTSTIVQPELGEKTRVFSLQTNDPMIKINKLLNSAKEKFGDSICVRIASYDTKEKLDEAIEWLNASLRGSGDKTVLDEHGFATFIGASAPVLSVNNRLSFVGIIPNPSQFLTRVSAAIKLAE